MSKQNSLAGTSNSAAFMALICLIPIFIVIVTMGWGEILKPLFTFFSPLCYVVAFFIACVGVLMGKAVAAERVRISIEENPKYKTTWLYYFFVLLIISALGTMNMLFMTTQSQATLADALADTSTKLRQVQSSVDRALATPDFDKKKASVDSLFANLEAEMKNPANCGFGAESLQRLKELQAALPGLKPLSMPAVRPTCEAIPKFLAEYRKVVDSALDNFAANSPDKPKATIDLRKQINASINEQLAVIDEFKLNPSKIDKASALPVLEKSWALYEEVITKTEKASDKSLGLPARIVVQEVRGIGEIGHIIAILISQWTHVQTYIIIFGALFFDLILVAFFMRHLSTKVEVIEQSPFKLSSSNSTGEIKNIFDK